MFCVNNPSQDVRLFLCFRIREQVGRLGRRRRFWKRGASALESQCESSPFLVQFDNTISFAYRTETRSTKFGPEGVPQGLSLHVGCRLFRSNFPNTIFLANLLFEICWLNFVNATYLSALPKRGGSS